ncbi:hypothetical protein KUV62_10585 [Salipiger bermudensis]|uniref:hypothetical protein n=1 Tax=Salipiger bermudensis TaxID=344736 RepID=UPI001C99148F|nr:hypothetical protein [Salipiger bermudensis]MBY6004357.1 hypothetical protein [Salipiger bermudensis]
MEIILHAGAHRTATTSFQTYLRGAAPGLAAQGTGFWGPWRTRKGLFHGLTGAEPLPGDLARAQARVRLAAEASVRRGVARLLVSDENMLGTPRACLRAEALYPEAAARLQRMRAAFGRVDRLVLQIRSPEAWWSSALAFLLARGVAPPSSELLERLSREGRGWREVIADLACALPRAEIVVSRFESCAARPDALLLAATGGAGEAPPLPEAGIWAHRSPSLSELRAALAAAGTEAKALPMGEGPWRPFSQAQSARLRERYADDLFWLMAGADGLAQLTEDPKPGRDRRHWPPASQKRGQDDDSQGGRLAGTR